MKTYNLLLPVLFAFILSASCSTRTKDNNNDKIETSASKTETFKVWGQCEMCQTRIENAVKEDGATDATWDIKTQMLTVTYDPAKTNSDILSKKLASVGHDTEKYRAPDDVYANLPQCCHYERRK
jgi:mercuric ion binding protein